MHDEKREVRRLKREIKRAGSQHRRRLLKRGLAADPESAHEAVPDLGRSRSDALNGIDRPSRHRDGTGRSGGPGDGADGAAGLGFAGLGG